MAPKTKREIELEKEMAEMRGRMDALMATIGQQKPVSHGKQYVGIRNISSYTIGLVNAIQGEQGDVTLHAARFDTADPNSTAVVSAQFWHLIRGGRFVRDGMIVRDDSVAAGFELAAPDRPQDLAKGHEINQMVDPFTFIQDGTEDAIRERVASITSEPTLRRILAAVDFKVWQLGESFAGDKDRGKKAVKALPSRYTWVETLVRDRMDELNPLRRNVEKEREETASFRS